MKSSEIEGEKLNMKQVRSSIARRLGLEVSGLINSPRNVDGIVDMMLDATQFYEKPLTEKRLFDWHGAMFPTGRSGIYSIKVAQYRTGEMQIVSGGFGNEKVHYEAVLAKNVKSEMDIFLNWVNTNNEHDSIIKAQYLICGSLPFIHLTMVMGVLLELSQICYLQEATKVKSVFIVCRHK